MFLELKVIARKCLQISGYIYWFIQYMIKVLLSLIALVLNFQVHLRKNWKIKKT